MNLVSMFACVCVCVYSNVCLFFSVFHIMIGCCADSSFCFFFYFSTVFEKLSKTVAEQRKEEQAIFSFKDKKKTNKKRVYPILQ